MGLRAWMDWSTRIMSTFITVNSSFAPFLESLLFWTLVPTNASASVWTWRMSLFCPNSYFCCWQRRTSTILWPRLSRHVIYLQTFHTEEYNSYSTSSGNVALSLRNSAAASYAHQLQDREVTGMRWDRTAVSKPTGTEGWKSGPRTAKGENTSVATMVP